MDGIRGALPPGRLNFRPNHSQPGMSAIRGIVLGLLLWASLTRAAGEALDRIHDAFTFSTADGRIRSQLSGLLDLEAYALPESAPGLIYTESRALLNPRLTLFF